MRVRVCTTLISASSGCALLFFSAAALASGGTGGGGTGGGGGGVPTPTGPPCAKIAPAVIAPHPLNEGGRFTLTFGNITNCSVSQETLSVTFFDQGIVTTAAGVPNGQSCSAPGSTATLTLKPGETRPLQTQLGELCPSLLTLPSQHTVTARATASPAGTLLTTAVNHYEQLPTFG
jgi:hypothetical protein